MVDCVALKKQASSAATWEVCSTRNIPVIAPANKSSAVFGVLLECFKDTKTYLGSTTKLLPSIGVTAVKSTAVWSDTARQA